MLPQRQDAAGHRCPRGHRRRRGFAAAALDAHAHLGVLFRHVDARTPRMDHLHDSHPFSQSNVLLWKVFRGELKIKAEVSLACSLATIHLPRTTAKGMPSSPTLFSRA